MKSTAILLVAVGALTGSAATAHSPRPQPKVSGKLVPGQTPAQIKARLLGVLVYTELSMRFEERPARDVFRYLQSVLGIKIIGRYNDDKAGFGIDPTTPITIDISDQPALTVLELILEQCADLEPCTWQLRGGVRGGGHQGTPQPAGSPADPPLFGS